MLPKTLPQIAEETGVGAHVIRRLYVIGRLPEPPRIRGAYVLDRAAEADLLAALRAAGHLPASADQAAEVETAR